MSSKNTPFGDIEFEFDNSTLSNLHKFAKSVVSASVSAYTSQQIYHDITVFDGGYMVYIDIPGVNKEDIDLKLVNNTDVKIKFEKKRLYEKYFENEKYLIEERSFGIFEKTISLPNDADTSVFQNNKYAARYIDGVLRFTVPKIKKASDDGTKIKII